MSDGTDRTASLARLSPDLAKGAPCPRCGRPPGIDSELCAANGVAPTQLELDRCAARAKSAPQAPREPKWQWNPILLCYTRNYVQEYLDAQGAPAREALASARIDGETYCLPDEGGFRCPKCGSSYFKTIGDPGKSVLKRQCKGHYDGDRDYSGCSYTWTSNHDNAHGLWNHETPQEPMADREAF